MAPSFILVELSAGRVFAAYRSRFTLWEPSPPAQPSPWSARSSTFRNTGLQPSHVPRPAGWPCLGDEAQQTLTVLLFPAWLFSEWDYYTGDGGDAPPARMIAVWAVLHVLAAIAVAIALPFCPDPVLQHLPETPDQSPRIPTARPILRPMHWLRCRRSFLPGGECHSSKPPLTTVLSASPSPRLVLLQQTFDKIGRSLGPISLVTGFSPGAGVLKNCSSFDSAHEQTSAHRGGIMSPLAGFHCTSAIQLAVVSSDRCQVSLPAHLSQSLTRAVAYDPSDAMRPLHQRPVACRCVWHH